MKMKSGTAASSSSFIRPMVWKDARLKHDLAQAEVAEREREEEQREADREADEDRADHHD